MTPTDESCWEGVDELDEQVRTNLQHVFEKFSTLSKINIYKRTNTR